MNDTTPNPTIVVIIQVACDPASSGYSQLTQAVHAAVRASLDAQAALPATPVALADRTVTHTRHVGRTPQPRALGPTPPRPEPCCHDPRCDRNLLCLLLSPDSIRMIARRFLVREDAVPAVAGALHHAPLGRQEPGQRALSVGSAVRRCEHSVRRGRGQLSGRSAGRAQVTRGASPCPASTSAGSRAAWPESRCARRQPPGRAGDSRRSAHSRRPTRLAPAARRPRRG